MSAVSSCWAVADCRSPRAVSFQVQPQRDRMPSNRHAHAAVAAEVTRRKIRTGNALRLVTSAATMSVLALILLTQPSIAQVLPPPPAAQKIPLSLQVREFRFVGNKVYSQSDLAKITAPFTKRSITTAELEDARRAVTMYY